MFANSQYGQSKYADNNKKYPPNFVIFSQGVNNRQDDEQLGDDANK